jgi:hypothetical protein
MSVPLSLDQPLNEKLYKIMLNKLNKCINDTFYIFKRNFVFSPCCSSLAEKNVIKHSINIAKQNTTYSDEVIYCSVMLYYYMSIVVEYNTYTGSCYSNLKTEYGGTHDVDELIRQITTSDEEWASQIRKIINNMNPEPFAGGKNRLKRRKTKRSNKSRRRKSKRSK